MSENINRAVAANRTNANVAALAAATLAAPSRSNSAKRLSLANLLSAVVCWTTGPSGFNAIDGVLLSDSDRMLDLGSLPNVKDEPRPQPARLLRQQET